MTVSDSWTCPRCNGTWNRMDQTRDEWATALRRTQTAHGPRCARKASTR